MILYKNDNLLKRERTTFSLMVFPLWTLPFTPKFFPAAFGLNFAINIIVVWTYLKLHKKFNKPKIYCFMAPGSQQQTQIEINNRLVFKYCLRAAFFGCFTVFLGGTAIGLLLKKFPIIDKYIDTFYVWSSFASGFFHILIAIFAGFIVYHYHRRMVKIRLGLDTAEASFLGIVIGLLTVPEFFLIPASWLSGLIQSLYH